MSLRRRTAILSLTGAVAATALAGVPAADAKAKVTCDTAAGRTVAIDDSAFAVQRTFRTVVRSKRDPDASTMRVFACTTGTRTIRQIARFDSNLDLEFQLVRARYAGPRYVVLQLVELTGVAASRSFRMYDVRTGRLAASTFDDDASSGTAMATTTSGAFAHLTDSGGLVVSDAAGTRTVVPTGVSELASAGDTVYYRAGGAPQAITLTGPATGTS